ncbi:cytochrome P450 [Mycena sanguinolenta]|nr:cytochrome P450 [Mycena sanguinolenta]
MSGRDTTMHIRTIVIYLYLHHVSDVCSRVREEILAHIGPSRRPNYEDIRDTKYLRAVLNGTQSQFLLRLIKPLVPYSVFMRHRRKDLWGPDAEDFSPDRFLDERLQTYLLKNNFQFLPFNAGPRICLGQQFAYNEMSFMIVRLLQAFLSFSLDEEAFPPGAFPPPK